MDIRFLSKNKPEEIGYAVSHAIYLSDSSPRGGKETIKWARQYLTYGDGLTQHAHLSNIPLENVSDFLEALADYWLSSATKEEKDAISREFRLEAPDRKTIRFFAELKPREGKTLYFNPRDLKVSSSPNKQHDKRWEKLTDYMSWVDGSAAAIYALLKWPENNYDDALDTYRKYSCIHDTLKEEYDRWSERPAKFCGLEDDKTWGGYLSFDTSYRILSQLVESYCLHAAAVCTVQRREEHRQFLKEREAKEIAEKAETQEIEMAA